MYAFLPAVIRDVAVGDINGDGRLDIVMAATDPNNLQLLLGNASGGFDPPSAVPLPGRPIRLVVQDFNHDNVADVAVTYSHVETVPVADIVTIFVSTGSGGLGAPVNLTLPDTTNTTLVFALGDLNGDTHVDLGVRQFEVGTPFFVLFGDGAGGFASQIVPNVPATPPAAFFTSGDVNGDGFRDLVAAGGNVSRVLVQLGNGAGAFGEPSYFMAPFGAEPHVADLNGDHRLDIAVARNISGTGGVSILFNGCGQPTDDLAVTVTDAPDPVDEGSAVIYSMTVTNSGTAATGVAVAHVISQGVVVSATPTVGTCSVNGAGVNCALGSIAAGATANIEVAVTTTAGGILTSTVGVSSNRADATPADNTRVVLTTVNSLGRSLVVTNTNDSGPGSLRQAITESNGDSGDVDQIVFNIGAGGPQTITPLTPLPLIFQPTVIDATTQPGYAGTPIVELNGNGLNAQGLSVSGGNTTIRGLVINRFTGSGISIGGEGGNVVEGSYVGTNAAGTLAAPNSTGILITGSSTNRIGGLSAAQRNVISGNSVDGIAIVGAGSTGNSIQGNYIGTNAAGSAAIPNQLHGASITGAPGNVIGGSAAGAGNLLSGNTSNGVGIFEIGATGNRVEGNTIGTNAAVTGVLPNGIDGIGIVRAPNNIVLNNTVGGNLRMGVGIFESTATGNVVQANRIGTNVAHVADFGNGGDGVHISFTASNNTIGGLPGGGNVIAFNTGRGISIVSGTGNRLSANSIFSNDQIGIDLNNNGVTLNDVGDGDTGANNLQNFPVLTSAVASGSGVSVQGTLSSIPNTAFQVEILADGADPSGFGEGATPLIVLNVTTNGAGSATFTTEVLSAANMFTATATDPGGNTSEFSAAVVVTGAPEGATIVATDATAAELGGDTATFVISRPSGEPTTADRPVTVTISGTAAAFVDYSSSSGLGNGGSFSLTIPAGQTSVTVTVTPNFDPALEGSETVTFTVEGTSATATIADEPAATIAVTDATAAELGADTATFVISRAGGASTAYDRPVTVTISGTAAAFVDYSSSSGLGNGGSFSLTIPAGQTSVTVTVTPNFDPALEGSETVTFTVEGTSATATIADEPAATIAVADATAAELGADTATFVISRAGGASTAYDRPVTVTISGTAAAFVDYSSSSDLGNGGSFSLTIPVGQTSVTVTVTPNTDAVTEGPETVILTVEGTSATATITDAPVSTQRTWISDADGAWDNPANWSGGVVPQPGETVVIDRPTSITVTLSSATSIASLTSQERLAIAGGSLTSSGPIALNGGLTMSSGLITGDGDLTLGGTSGWTGGPITGTGSMAVSSGATLTLNTPGGFGVLGRDLSNSGTIIWNQASLTLSGLTIVNNASGVFEIQSNLAISNGTFTNAGRLFKSGPTGPLTLSNVAFATSGSLDLRIASATQFDSIQSDGIGGVSGTLNVALQGGFVPSLETAFNVLTFGALSGTFVAINGNGQGYNADYTATTLNLTATAGGVATPIGPGGFSGSETIETFSPNFGRQNSPVTFNGITYATVPPGQLWSDINWTANGYYTNWPTASAGTGLNDLVGQTHLQIDFSTPVNRVGILAATSPATTYTMTAYDDLLNALGSVTQTMPAPARAVFLGLQASVNIRRIVITEPVDNGQVSIFDDLRYESTTSGRPIANAGVDQTVSVGQTVNLSGAASSDPNSDPLTYAWSFVSRPAGSNAALTSATTVSPTFVPDVAGTYVVQLVVNDGTQNSNPDTVSIVAELNSIVLTLVDTTLVGVGRQATLRVTLPFAAPAGGVTATVNSGNTNLLTVASPGTIAFAQGQTVGQILVNGVQAGNVTVTATAPGYSSGTLNVSVTQNLISTPANLNVPFGQSIALPVNIGPSPAPPGGLTLSVVSANSAIVEVLTPQITIAEGALSANATVRGAQIGAVSVTVSNPAYSPSTTLVTSSAELNIVQASAGFNVGLPAPLLTVRLESSGTPIAAQQTLTVNLASANTACVTVPATVTIPNGQVTTTFTPAYGGTAPLPCTTTVTASATGLVSDSVSITVSPQTNITAPGAVVVGSRLMLGTGASLGTTQHGGVTVTVTSSDATRLLVSRNSATAGTGSTTVIVPDGTAFIPYVVHGVENTTGSATITLSATGIAGDSHLVTVVPIGVEIHGLEPTMSTASGEDTDPFVQVGIPNLDNSSLAQVQQVRAGSPLVVTLSNSNSVVGRLRSDQPAATGQSVTKPIQPGIYFSQAVAAGTGWGLAFLPLANGTTTVTATGPPGVLTMTTTGVREVVVSGASISPPATVVVGSRLMTATGAFLSASNHGGIDVTVTSNTPGTVLVSRDSLTAGSASTTVTLPNGQPFVSYYVHGVDNTTGSATISVSAPGFGSTSHQVDVVAPGLEIHALDTPTSTLAAEDVDVFVQVGIPNADGSALSQIQFVRAGAPLVVTLTNSNDAVGRLRSDEPPVSGQIVTKPIQPGAFFTTAAQSGTFWGLAFEALNDGATTVTITGPPGVRTMSQTGVRQVVVQESSITPPATTLVGTRLMVFTGATLGVPSQGGIDVTVTRYLIRAGCVWHRTPRRLVRHRSSLPFRLVKARFCITCTESRPRPATFQSP